MLRSLLIAGPALLAACHHGPRVVPAPDPVDELAGRYPGTDAAARAQMHVQQLREWFSQKDYKNGMFYFRRRAYDSAIIYFKDVIATYPGTSRVPDALMRLVDSYRVIGYGDELKETCAHLP